MSNVLLPPDAPLLAAVRAIESSHRRIAVVVNKDDCLLGTLTDGDVRRCLLDGGNLQTPVSQAMNTSPLSALVGSSAGHMLGLMRSRHVMVLPLIEPSGRFVRLMHLTDLDNVPAKTTSTSSFSFAVIMAGGEGMRLRPLTENIPKPMVDIGGIPLLERQIQRLAAAGVGKVYLSLNYLGHVIEEHFSDGRKFGIEVCYLREKEKLGTAGALSLLPEQPEGPILVMNGDILSIFQ
ncbi:MAG: NTP transferase domain-containing protein, partial [Limnobacter sp.]|nr:NTP transferase domain-containing protein [Limnobacter sp.]